VVERFEPFLSLDEKARAAQFRFDHLRDRYVIARGALRALFGSYLNITPASVQFEYGSNGKPALAAPESIHFNVSHSAGLAVFAFTRGCELGIDLEQIHPIREMENIANRFFCSEEAVELMALSAKQREHAFFLCWTRKEAYIKGTGDGFSVPLNNIRVTLQPGQPAQFVHLARDTNAAKEWMLHDLQLTSDFAAALAYRDPERPVVVSRIIDPAELLSILSI
jgi:4'-phosphopantetheinyl transferase